MVCSKHVSSRGNSMKIVILFFSFLILCSIPTGLLASKANQKQTHNSPAEASEQGKAGDKTRQSPSGTPAVAVLVNGVPIMENTVMEAAEWLRQQQRERADKEKGSIVAIPDFATAKAADANTTATKDDQDMRQAALDRLIDEELAVQEAKKEGIKVPAGIIRSVTSMLRYQAETTPAQDKPAQSPTSKAELRRRIIRDYLYKQVCIKNIIPNIEIDPETVKKIYENNRDKFIIPEKIVITDLYFLPSKQDKKLQEHAENVLDKLLSIPDRDIKKLKHDGSYLVRTIQIYEEKDPDLYFAAWDMEPGEVSGIIKAQDGMHIIKVEEKENERKMTFDEARPVIKRQLVTREYKKLYRQYFSKLREKAAINYSKKMISGPPPARE